MGAQGLAIGGLDVGLRLRVTSCCWRCGANVALDASWHLLEGRVADALRWRLGVGRADAGLYCTPITFSSDFTLAVTRST